MHYSSISSNYVLEATIPREQSKVRIKTTPLSIPQIESTLFNLVTKCIEEKPANIYECSRDFFKALLYQEKSREGSVDNSMVSVDLTDRFRHKTIYNTSQPEASQTQTLITYAKSKDQAQRIKSLIPKIFFLKHLDEYGEKLFVDAAVERYVRPGESIIEAGGVSDTLYLVEEGIFKSFLIFTGTEARILKKKIKAGGYFGEGAIVHDSQAKYSVEAVTEGLLWCLEGEVLKEIEMRTMRSTREKYNNLIDKVPILKGLSEDDKNRLADAFTTKVYDKGDIIVHEKDNPKGVYFVQKGEVSCTIYDDDQMNFVEIHRIPAGKYFGIMALLEPNRKNFIRFTAVEDTLLAFLEAEGYHRLLADTCALDAQTSILHFKSKFRDIMGVDYPSISNSASQV